LNDSTITSELGCAPPDWRKRQYFVRVTYLIAGAREHGYPVPVVLPLLRSRSSSLSFTTYLFTALCFAVTMHLRHYGAIDSEIYRKVKDGEY
jgi:hypothetical protein